MKKKQKDNFTVRVYLDDGRVFEIYVSSEDSAREYAGVISTRGYRHHYGDALEYFPVHRVTKVAINGPTTKGFVAGSKDTNGWRA